MNTSFVCYVNDDMLCFVCSRYVVFLSDQKRANYENLKINIASRVIHFGYNVIIRY